MNPDRNRVSVERFHVWAGALTSASDVLLSRVEAHLVVAVRLHHVIGGSGDDAMVRGAHPGLIGRHPEPGGD